MCMTETPNRIEAGVIRMRKQIADRNVPQATLDSLHKSLDLAFIDYCSLQDVKSQAFAGGTLTLDEANYVYGILGTTPDHFNRQPLAEKVIITQLAGELLKLRLNR